MTTEEHRQRHIELHRALDELVADWITHARARPSEGTVLDLLRWSSSQAEYPTEGGEQ